MTVLILASRYDLTCDYVISQLRRLKCPYHRINSEDLPKMKLSFDPIKGDLHIKFDQSSLLLRAEEIRSVYFRRPVYLRDYGTSSRSPVEGFYRNQWSAFIRNLMVFEEAVWVNHPSATYLAEHKAYQLHKASSLGFQVPRTIVTNSSDLIDFGISSEGKLVVKGLDTVLLREGPFETFGFTQILDEASLKREHLISAPTVIQEPISQKLDVRVTAIGSDVFAASIESFDQPIRGDWRSLKGNVRYLSHNLPNGIATKCIELLKELGLFFGAIDLALSHGEYFFLEVNATGEWAWLVDSAKLPIDIAIANLLSSPPKNDL